MKKIREQDERNIRLLMIELGGRSLRFAEIFESKEVKEKVSRVFHGALLKLDGVINELSKV